MKAYFDLDKRLKHENCINGTLVTNFDNSILLIYANAIQKAKLTGTLIISPFAYNSTGDYIEGYCSLHTLSRIDLGEFLTSYKLRLWHIYTE